MELHWSDLLDSEDAAVAERPEWSLPQRMAALLSARRRMRGVMVGAAGSGRSTEVRGWIPMLSSLCTVMVVDLGGTGDLPLHLSLTRALGGSREEQLREVIADWSRERPLLLVVEGFEHGEAPMFGPHSPWFDPLLPSVVVMAPARSAAWGRERWDPRFDWIAHFPPFPVQNPDGSPNPAGARPLAKALAQRLGQRASPLLLRLVLASGGLPKDAVRLWRSALSMGAGRLHKTGVEAAEEELREELRAGLTPRLGAQLRKVKAAEEVHPSPILFDRGLLLRRGGVYTVHPLLLPVL